MKNKTSRNIWIHPLLFGLYPVLALYVFNRHEIVFSAIQQAVVTSFIITVAVIAAFLLVLRSWQRAAIPSSFTLLLFLSYGHFFDLVKNINLFGESIGHHRILLPFMFLVYVTGLILILRIKNNTGVNRTLDSISLLLMAFLAVQVISTLVQIRVAERRVSQLTVAGQEHPVTESVGRDVYYILVDAYSRPDLLRQKLNLDTSGFISELMDLGFYIPACAQSNYHNTYLSLASTLNMEYLDALEIDYPADKAELQTYIRENLVMKRFEALGYDTYTFKSLYPEVDIQDSTYYYDYFQDASALDSQASLNFQYLFLRTTLVRPLMQYIEGNENIKLSSFWSVWIPAGNTLNSRDYRQYQQNTYALDSLEKIPDRPGKKFVYAHLYVMHQPFVFFPDGRFHPSLAQDYDAYRDQVIFANKRLLEIVKAILARSDPAPVIVIQGDHSYFDLADRVKILSAYYFPEGGDQVLHRTVTPVNTFRLIFNTYYGGDYELLPDVSFYGDENRVLHETPLTCENE